MDISLLQILCNPMQEARHAIISLLLQAPDQSRRQQEGLICFRAFQQLSELCEILCHLLTCVLFFLFFFLRSFLYEKYGHKYLLVSKDTQNYYSIRSWFSLFSLSVLWKLRDAFRERDCLAGSDCWKKPKNFAFFVNYLMIQQM